MVDVVMESVRNVLLSEMLYADDLVLTSKMMEGLREKFCKWKEAFESNGLKVNLRNTEVVVSETESEMSVEDARRKLMDKWNQWRSCVKSWNQ